MDAVSGMAVLTTINCIKSQNPNRNFLFNSLHRKNSSSSFLTPTKKTLTYRHPLILNELRSDPSSNSNVNQGNEVDNLGVKVALSMLKLYKREISPLMLKSCRYVPTCSEYSMEAYKKYGVVKGSVLTAWRVCRCNPLGGSGFDPPRWFDEKSLPEE